MALSNNVISQFVRVTSNKPTRQTETTHFGTVVEYDGGLYVQLDGSEVLTPVSTTSNMKAGDRVTVLLKNHNATVTGNVTDPSASSGKVTEIGDTLDNIDVFIADKIIAGELEATIAQFDTIYAKSADIDQIIADKIIAGELDATIAEFDKLYAKEAEIDEIISDKIVAGELSATIAEFDKLYAKQAEIDNLENKYANIEFSNIKESTMEKFYADSGLIKDATIENGTITGTLAAVKITADSIDAGTIVADKLVIQGEDGLYYKLNTDGMEITAEEQDITNSLHGSVILAESITADKISVSDLVAFGATIGGFKINEDALYSGVKESIENTTDGVYMDDEGQFALGNSLEYLKYYKDANNNRHLEIAASSIVLKSSGKTVEDTLNDIEIGGTNLIRNSINLIFEDYYFDSETLTATDDGNGNVTITHRLANSSVDGEGNVTISNDIKATHNGSGNVTLTV